MARIRVGTTATVILPANQNRTSYNLQNESTTDVYIGFDQNVATSGEKQGFNLRASGGSAEEEFHRGEVWGIASSAVSITVNETFKDPWGLLPKEVTTPP